uniref:chorismate-binding protein n=1 Tax=Serratia marcescens TaxID=615 RepID=UPI001C379AE7
RAASEGDDILYVRNAAGQVSAVFQAVGAGGWQGPAALLLGKNSVNGRSVGAAGTVNASGADYAEYMIKAAGCGIIADSEPANEYQETELKLSGMQAAIRVRDAAADANARGTAKVSTSSTVE